MRGLLTLLVATGCSFTAAAPGNGEPDAPSADAPAVPLTCPASYTEKYMGHSYRLTSDLSTWPAAQLECANEGGHLIKIESREEDDELARRIFLDPATVWIGLHDRNQDGVYLWSDGDAPSYRNYSGTAPGSTSPDCIQKSTNDSDGRWYTLGCTDQRRAICECDAP